MLKRSLSNHKAVTKTVTLYLLYDALYVLLPQAALLVSVALVWHMCYHIVSHIVSTTSLLQRDATTNSAT
jgi:hypothetical protein